MGERRSAAARIGDDTQLTESVLLARGQQETLAAGNLLETKSKGAMSTDP